MNNAVKAILTLIVILAALQIAVHYKEGIKPILALIDKSILDQDLIDRYAALEGEDKEAINSMKALTYAVNRLAWFDTYSTGNSWKWDDNVNIADELDANWYVTQSGTIVKGNPPAGYDQLGSYQSFGRKYGDTSVIPTIMDTNLILINEPNKDLLLKQLAKDTVDCLDMFREMRGENIRCYAMDFSGIPTTTKVTKSDLPKGFELLQADSNLCDDLCQKSLKDLTGNAWWDFWNVANWEYSIKGGTITNQNNRQNNNVVRICGDAKGVDKVYVTDDFAKCKTPADALMFTMMIKDFSLPQDVDNTWFTKAFLPHGDPKYIIYYEQFPDGEDSLWRYNSFSEFGTFLSVEGFLFAVRMIPKAGGPLHSVLNSPQGRLVLGEIITKAITLQKSLLNFHFTNIKNFNAAIDELAQATIKTTNFIIGKDTKIEDIHSGIQDYVIVKYGGEYIISKYFSMISDDYYKEDTEKANVANGQRYNYEEKFLALTDSYFDSNKAPMTDTGFSAQFKQDAVNAFTQVENNAKFSEYLAESVEEHLKTGLFDTRWMFKVSSQSNDKMLELYEVNKVDSDQRKQELQAIFLKNTEILSTMGSKDKRDYELRKSIVLGMMLEEQEKNPKLKNKFENKDMDDIAKNIMKEIVLEPRPTSRDMNFKDISVDRFILSSELVISTYRTANMAEKFYFIGTNSIGLKTPYKGVVRFDDSLTKTWQWPKDKDKYLDYFNYFGGVWEPVDKESAQPPKDYQNKHYTERYLGLVPEANRYYLSLARDKVWYWKDQPNTRFHLVSPCGASVMIKVTQCECYGNPSDEQFNALGVNDLLVKLKFKDTTYETGKYNPVYDTTIQNFDGQNPMLYGIDSDTGQIIKDCKPKGFGDSLPWSNDPYTPLCIEFDPLMDNENPNYCYKGVEPAWLGVSDAALNWGLPFACASGTVAGAVASVVGAPVATVAPVSWAVCGVAGNLLYSSLENTCLKWPAHGSESFTCS
ncbi:MAG: hypothetical protein ABIJ34_00625 [archaeon]